MLATSQHPGGEVTHQGMAQNGGATAVNMVEAAVDAVALSDGEAEADTLLGNGNHSDLLSRQLGKEGAAAASAREGRIASPHPNADQPKHSQPHAFRGDIESLRGIAVATVIIYHFFPEGLPGGLTGVDVFFTISGFVISLMLSNWFRAKEFSITRFYAFRFRRLLPASSAVLIGTLVAVWWLLDFVTLQRTVADSRWATLFSANYHFYLDAIDYNAPQSPSVFLHFWSLAVEEQFYVVWPLFLWGLVSLEQRAPRKGMAEGVVLATCIASYVWANHLLATETEKMAAFFLLPARWWELASGFLAFRAHEQLAALLTAAWRSRMATAGMAMIVLSTVVCSGQGWFPGRGALLPVVGTWLFLVAGAEAEANAALASSPLLRRLGQLSYSLYLVHWPVLIIGDYRNPNVGAFIGALVVVGLLAWLVSVAVEAPLRRHPRGLLVGAACIILSLVASSTLSLVKEPTFDGGEDVGGLVLDNDDSDSQLLPFDASNHTGGSDNGTIGNGTEAGSVPHRDAVGSHAFRELRRKDEKAWAAFRAFLSASMNRTALPAGIHPSLTSPRARRGTLPNLRWGIEKPAKTGVKPVWIRKKGKGTIVVAGDSHAAQWGFLLRRMAEALDMRLVFRIGSGAPMEHMEETKATGDFFRASEQLFHDATVFVTGAMDLRPGRLQDRNGDISESKVRAKVEEYVVAYMKRARRWNDNLLWWRMGNTPTACAVGAVVQTKKQALAAFPPIDLWHDDQYANSLAEHGMPGRTFYTPVLGNLVGMDGRTSAIVGNVVQFSDVEGPNCHLTGTYTDEIVGELFLPWLRLFHQPLLRQLCARSVVDCDARGWLGPLDGGAAAQPRV